MEIHKIIQEASEAARHWHLPLLLTLISHIKFTPKPSELSRLNDLGEITGDNVPHVFFQE